ncbi:MAG: penicillin-insensitive murein endopeptidase, partial [Polyangiaceae bacterium]|nr:penicillin-insensitive murein endopeptidase [Polyangiaceae bacterium]
MRFAPALLLLALPACTPGATAIPPATASRSSPGTAAAWSPPPAGTSTAATADDAANLASLDATYAPLDRGEAVGDDDPGAIDDEVEEPPAGTPSAAPKPILHPLAGLSESDLAQRLRSEPESLGPISLGRPNGGQLINSVRMPQGEGWELIDPAHAWGTQETIDALVRAVQKVQNSYPDCPKLQVGHISSRKGGPLSPHVSHQTGRD